LSVKYDVLFSSSQHMVYALNWQDRAWDSNFWPWLSISQTLQAV